MKDWHPTTVAEVLPAAEELMELILDLRGSGLVGTHLRPGQYVHLSLPGLGEAPFAIASAPNLAGVTRANLAMLNRLNYSFPPDHGAAVVETILSDPDLRTDWLVEIEAMRQSMLGLRTGLAEALRRATNSDRFDFLAHHRGMFSLTGASPEQVAALRKDHGIYMVGDGRINVAGLPAQGLDRLAASIAAVCA